MIVLNFVKNKSFIILSLIYNYNYRNQNTIFHGQDIDLIHNKHTLFEYLFFECHYYELAKLFPRNHDLLLKSQGNKRTLIEYDKNNWSVTLNAMPKLVHYHGNKKYLPKRVIVFLSIDVEMDQFSNVKWKKYFIKPQLIETKQTIIKNVIIESCINWNNILAKRKENLDIYPMIMLYYRIRCEYEEETDSLNRNVYTITSTVRTIHISTEIDMELNENEIRYINVYNNDANIYEIENNLLICDNMILHENAQIHSSYFNINVINL